MVPQHLGMPLALLMKIRLARKLATDKHSSLFWHSLKDGRKGFITLYEESVVDKFKSNLLLLIFWLNIINYNS